MLHLRLSERSQRLLRQLLLQLTVPRPPIHVPPTMTAVALTSVLTCPACGHADMLVMSTDACLFFHECAGCQTLLRPQPGHCCVFCSYGSVACPPIQAGGTCGDLSGACCEARPEALATADVTGGDVRRGTA